MSCFNNTDVETAVAQALADAGVEKYSGYILAQWELTSVDEDERGEVTSVSFTSDSSPLSLSCVVSDCDSKHYFVVFDGGSLA